VRLIWSNQFSVMREHHLRVMAGFERYLCGVIGKREPIGYVAVSESISLPIHTRALAYDVAALVRVVETKHRT
jgi:hypothetical protein